MPTAKAPPKNDAYTVLLVISLVATVFGCILLALDFMDYGEMKPPAVPTAAARPTTPLPGSGGLSPGGSLGGGPLGGPPPAPPTPAPQPAAPATPPAQPPAPAPQPTPKAPVPAPPPTKAN